MGFDQESRRLAMYWKSSGAFGPQKMSWLQRPWRIRERKVDVERPATRSTNGIKRRQKEN